jgi:hypothetical protein
LLQLVIPGKLFDYCAAQKLDAIFLQDSLDPEVMNPKHWADVRAWTRELGLHLETGGGPILPRTPDVRPRIIASLRKNIERAQAMGSPIVRALLAGDRYQLPEGSLAPSIEAAVSILREVRTQALDAGIKIASSHLKVVAHGLGASVSPRGGAAS